MEIERIIISASITMFSFGLLFISLLSYRRTKNTKLLFVSLVFFIFLIKGLLLSIHTLFSNAMSIEMVLGGSYGGILDLFILICLFIATLKR